MATENKEPIIDKCATAVTSNTLQDAHITIQGECVQDLCAQIPIPVVRSTGPVSCKVRAFNGRTVKLVGCTGAELEKAATLADMVVTRPKRCSHTEIETAHYVQLLAVALGAEYLSMPAVSVRPRAFLTVMV